MNLHTWSIEWIFIYCDGFTLYATDPILATIRIDHSYLHTNLQSQLRKNHSCSDNSLIITKSPTFILFYLSYNLLLKFIPFLYFIYIYIETAGLKVYFCCCLSHLYSMIWICWHEILSEFSSTVIVSLYMLQTQFWQWLELIIRICSPTSYLSYERITVILIVV